MKPIDEETFAILRESYPVEQGGGNKIFLPRLGMVSQDKVEETGTGRNKTIKVIAPAGEFFIENQTEEVDENGKRMWDRKELGDTIEGIILYQRKQLKMYDEKTEQYTSSPVYDDESEIVPLFCDKVEVAKGTPEELKAKYQYTADNGKTRSKLEDNRILYVLYDGEVYQMNLRGSSMYSFMTYARSVLVPSVITQFSSESKEKGTIAWNQMTFTAVRPLGQKEALDIAGRVQEIRSTVEAEKAQYSKNVIQGEVVSQAEEDYKNL